MLELFEGGPPAAGEAVVAEAGDEVGVDEPAVGLQGAGPDLAGGAAGDGAQLLGHGVDPNTRMGIWDWDRI